MNDLYIQTLRIDWNKVEKDSYLRQIPAIRLMKQIEFSRPVTFFAGENGSGKSTLLEAAAVSYGFNPEGGTRNYSFSTYDSHSELEGAIVLGKGCRLARWGYFFRAESFYNVATQEEVYAEESGVVSAGYHRQSHGESFLSLAQDNFRKNGLFILDEPEAALSPQRQLTLLMEISHWAKEGAQFIIASHSPILLGIPEAEILEFDDKGIHSVSYEDTESYRLTKMFLDDRENLLRHLLE